MIRQKFADQYCLIINDENKLFGGKVTFADK